MRVLIPLAGLIDVAPKKPASPRKSRASKARSRSAKTSWATPTSSPTRRPKWWRRSASALPIGVRKLTALREQMQKLG
jgi:hypothetical protein